MAFLHICLYVLIALCLVCLYRAIIGPTVADRVVAIDIFGIIVVGVCVVLSLITNKSYIIDIGIAWIILSFIGTLTMAKYLGKQKLNE
jgi:multicomponent Na+:H+ antiporter subunit F